MWSWLPELEALKDKGYAALDIIMRLGGGPDGFAHIVRKHGQWIMDAMGIDDPVRACKMFIAEVLGEVRKIQYQQNKGKDALLLKQGEEQRYFIVVIGKDRVEPNFAAVRTAFVADRTGRFDSEITLFEGEEALELRIPMSSFGENQRLRGASERQDRSSDYPDTAAASPSEDIMPQVGRVVKHEELISYKNDSFSANMERNLAAVHTLSAEKFLGALELGGMPLPSVAVTRLDRPYEWGGADGIALVGRPELVDPKKGAEVFSRDAWTGNFPRVVNKPRGKKEREAACADLHALRDRYQIDYDSRVHTLDYRIAMNYGGEETERGDMEFALRQPAGKALFAWQSGYRPRPKMKDAVRTYEWLTRDFAARLREFTKLSADEYQEKLPDIMELVREAAEAFYAQKGIVKNAPNAEFAQKRLKVWVNTAVRAFDVYSPSVLARALDDVKKEGTRVLDSFANLDMLAAYAEKHKRAYEAWVQAQLEAWFSKEGYIKGTRTVATLEALTEYMLGEKARGKEKGMAFSSGLVRAHHAERMDSLADIQGRRELLTDSAASNELKSETNELIGFWREGAAAILSRGMNGFGFEVRDELMEALAKVKGEPTAEKLRAVVRRMFRGATNLQELLNNAKVIGYGVDALKSLRRELEDYMEAVPQRAVKMDEWEYAVMPLELKKNKAVMAGLRENGIKPRFHDGTEEGRRGALAALVDDSKVSFCVIGPKAETFDQYTDRAFKGRDDGMLRAEIDASGAKLKSEDLRGKNLKAYRQIIADWNELPEAERKEVEAYAELCAERDEAANKLNETNENDFQEAYAVAKKLADEVNSKRVKVREIIGEFFKMKGADGSVGITAKNEIIDAMAFDFWCEWGSDKVENSLASDPMAMGMALMDVLDYPELYEAYPQLETLLVYTEDLKGYYGMAGNNGWSDYIMMNRSLLDNWEQFRSTLLHEVQHVIQRIEGFAKGGNKESVLRKVKALLEGTGARIDMLERDLRWFSAVDIARDLLKEARSLRRYPNAWKRSGRRFEFARMSDSAEEIREKILRDIAERYKEFRRDDTSETLLLDMPDLLLPEVHFHSVDSIEAGLAALDKLKSRKLVFRGTAAKKNRRLKELQKRHDAMQKVLSEFEYEPYELYLRLAGEIEARNVQARRDWTMAERLARPFNETLEYPGEALVTFSMSPTLLEDIGRARKRAKNADGSISQDGEMSRNAEVELCTMPDFMRYLGEPDVPVVARVFTLRKLLTDHNLTDELTYEVVEKMNDPVLAVQETPSKLLLLLDLEAENKSGNVTPIVAIIEHKQNNEGSRYLVSAYSLEDDKVTKITNQFSKLVYCKYNTTAKFTANAPQGRAYELLRAAISGGHTSNVADLEDVVKFNQANFSASMEKASLQALDVLRTRADEREGERLMNEWQKACEGWAQLHVGGDDSRLGNGAKMLGEIYALIGATKGVLPEKYARMGHLNGLLRWAAVYAQMQQTGEVPAEGVIAGPIYEKFVERMRYIDKKNEAYGLNEAEVKEAMALLAGERLDVAMLKVARECKRRLEMFLKDRERERIDWVVERAYPKREKGKRSPRGKMDAETYRRMERAYRLMEMEANEVAGLMNRMLYWDKAKARIWMQAYRLQLRAQVLPKRASGRRIQTPADLVKYKMQTGLSFLFGAI